MKCPVCASTHLLISERQGIEIDYCPQCRGVWLDRGELDDKLIERAPAVAPSMAQHHAPPPQPGRDQRYGHVGHAGHGGHYQRDGHRPDHDYNYKRKKKGFLGEIFDFD